MTHEEFFTVLEYVAEEQWHGEIPPLPICIILWNQFNEMSMDEFEKHLTTRWQEIQEMSPQERIKESMEQAKKILHHYKRAESAELN